VKMGHKREEEQVTNTNSRPRPARDQKDSYLRVEGGGGGSHTNGERRGKQHRVALRKKISNESENCCSFHSTFWGGELSK